MGGSMKKLIKIAALALAISSTQSVNAIEAFFNPHIQRAAVQTGLKLISAAEQTLGKNFSQIGRAHV